jgi:hypothetical protein
MLGLIPPSADIAPDPLRPIHAAGDDDPFLVDDRDDGARGQVLNSQCLRELIEPGPDHQDPAQSPVSIFQWMPEVDDPPLAQTPDDHVADREALALQDLPQICAAARIHTSQFRIAR